MDEVLRYWKRLVSTLAQRDMLRTRPRQGGAVLPQADVYILPERIVFVLDMQRLGGISREEWLNPDLWAQWRCALHGRPVFVTDSAGLAITIGRHPLPASKRLPRMLNLTAEHIPSHAYHICMGYAQHGVIALDLAVQHRAILIGGTSGYGKTNLMHIIVQQLAIKHSPKEVLFAVVDLKGVDFTGEYARLPHLFTSIAYDLATATRVVRQVEQEQERRAHLLHDAQVKDWLHYKPRLPLLVLLMDETADIAGTPAMDSLIDIARKGRAFGISVVVGTQHPTAKVVDSQIKANLSTAIAFKTRSDVESRTILGRRGAEDLDRAGLALSYLHGRWENIQTLYADPETSLIAEQLAAQEKVFSELEKAMIVTAVTELKNAFSINGLYTRYKGQISKRRIAKLAQTWEQRQWLTRPSSVTSPRYVTPELLRLAAIPTTG